MRESEKTRERGREREEREKGERRREKEELEQYQNVTEKFQRRYPGEWFSGCGGQQIYYRKSTQQGSTYDLLSE